MTLISLQVNCLSPRRLQDNAKRNKIALWVIPYKTTTSPGSQATVPEGTRGDFRLHFGSVLHAKRAPLMKFGACGIGSSEHAFLAMNSVSGMKWSVISKAGILPHRSAY